MMIVALSLSLSLPAFAEGFVSPSEATDPERCGDAWKTYNECMGSDTTGREGWTNMEKQEYCANRASLLSYCTRKSGSSSGSSSSTGSSSDNTFTVDPGENQSSGAWGSALGTLAGTAGSVAASQSSGDSESFDYEAYCDAENSIRSVSNEDIFWYILATSAPMLTFGTVMTVG